MTTVFLLRHAQSVFNAIFDATGEDPNLADAPLSALGIEQARDARHRVAGIAPDIILTSPLTRALRTAQIVAAGIRAKIHVDPVLRERVVHSCDVGRPRSILVREFPMADFTRVDETWWTSDEFEREMSRESQEELALRVSRFCAQISRYAGKTILLVGHYDFFLTLTGLPMANCQLMEWRVPSPDDDLLS